VPGHTGRSIFENFRGSTSVLVLAKDMQTGRSGKAVYDFRRPGEPASAAVRKRAVYMPIDLGNTFWSVAVATPESEALSSLAALRNRLVLITISIFCCGAFLAFFGLKAGFILKEERKRRRAEEALRLSEEKFEKAFRASPDSVLITRLADGRIQEINACFTRLTGHPAGEALGKTTLELGMWAAPEDRTRYLERLRADGRAAGQEFELCTKSGERRSALVSGEVIEVNGEPCALSVIRDITESKQQGIERRRLQDQLLQSIKMESLGRLAGGIAHDFNNLLTAIMGNASLALLDLDEKNPVAAQLRDVNQAAERASALTRQLLAFSRRQIIEPKPLSLNDLINNLNKLMIRVIGEDVELRVRLDAEPSTVLIDPGQFEQVLINLAVNARDAMPDGGELGFETANAVLDEEYCSAHPPVRPGRFVMLTVRDTGHGMSDAVRQRIFEPFFTTKEQGRGTGLGLAMVFGAVTQAEGTVEVDSEPGKGTTFKVYLPQVEAPAEAIAPADASGRPERGTETILVVEDDPAVLQLVRSTLRRLGYTVLEAQNGAAAIELAGRAAGPIHLLLTDVVLPGMNGRELAERLLTTRPEMRVLYTSGYTEDVIVHRGVVDAGVSFIGKPHTPRALARKIRQVLESTG
jgi:PAS domain S-box-containing protein